MTQPTTTTSEQLRKAVLEDLDYSASVGACLIGVSVEGDCATLTGQVATYPETLLAAKVAVHVPGVEAVAQELSVKST